jgi:hypothetical protein
MPPPLQLSAAPRQLAASAHPTDRQPHFLLSTRPTCLYLPYSYQILAYHHIGKACPSNIYIKYFIQLSQHSGPYTADFAIFKD